ncbi:hypothetical protein [Acinetobacter sp. P1(2025)]|uniref:hypothetical protein n=1 Tax=Acinetobacter sp. P1(2025) TaxID=3446120 RepID=UPI003F52DE1B
MKNLVLNNGIPSTVPATFFAILTLYTAVNRPILAAITVLVCYMLLAIYVKPKFAFFFVSSLSLLLISEFCNRYASQLSHNAFANDFVTGFYFLAQIVFFVLAMIGVFLAFRSLFED